MRKKVLMSISFTLIFLILFIFGIYRYALSPIKEAERESVQIAGKYADLRILNKFYWYHHDKTYYTLFGENSKQKKIIVLIAKKGGNVTILDQNKGINEAQAIQIVKEKKKPAKILRVSFGIYKKKPVWEISYKSKDGSIGYYTVTFTHGETMQVIENI